MQRNCSFLWIPTIQQQIQYITHSWLWSEKRGLAILAIYFEEKYSSWLSKQLYRIYFWINVSSTSQFLKDHRSTWYCTGKNHHKLIYWQPNHALSQQGVWASFRHQTLKTHPSGHSMITGINFLKCQFQAYNWHLIFHLNIIPMTFLRT